LRVDMGHARYGIDNCVEFNNQIMESKGTPNVVVRLEDISILSRIFE